MLEKIPIYELPFRENEKLEFKIYRVQDSEIEQIGYPHKTKLPHKHNYYEMCFFTGGSGEHEIDFKIGEIVYRPVEFKGQQCPLCDKEDTTKQKQSGFWFCDILPK